MKKVLVLPSSFGKFSNKPKEILESAGLEAIYYSKSGMTEDEVIDKLQRCDGVILGLEPMTARVMDACKSLKCIVRFGVGMDNVDQTAAKERGIKLGNTPGAERGCCGRLCLWYDALSGPLHPYCGSGPEGRTME